MNITDIEPHAKNNEMAEEWYFRLDNIRYRYRTYAPYITLWNHQLSESTYVSCVSDGTTSHSLPQFLPLDPNNPKQGIERFYKLLMLQ